MIIMANGNTCMYTLENNILINPFFDSYIDRTQYHI